MDKETCLAPLGGEFLFNAVFAQEGNHTALVNVPSCDEDKSPGNFQQRLTPPTDFEFALHLNCDHQLDAIWPDAISFVSSALKSAWVGAAVS
jgi:hypothetical protein